MPVPVYGQKYRMSCWAASMRMILASRLRFVDSDDAIAAPTNDQASLLSGLNPNATASLRNWGFRTLAPMCYTESGFATLVQSRGPLWVACDVRFPGASRSSPHIRVVTDALTINGALLLGVNDPGPVGVGSRYQETYANFCAKNEMLGSQELGEPAPVYIAHL
ncbi:papain-like cysteine protease family protein [Sphingomonas immobilis]|uniref:Papain-like cysteine protease family protein n=1 Tax=Sphingomonas immobilis TaxID=3063997 RepID=A0ABT9A5T0_9SPHN|nr:papain-like cysteine protease family protein [Sphingomonas sp. CA1-15]MDO7844102.1 papain-like cysteine protease family protein [Sphingomonas sp. CA1-15]